jgi:hypothetical protein
VKKSERERLARLKKQLDRTFEKAERADFDELLEQVDRYVLAARYPPTGRQVTAAQRLGVNPYDKRSLSLAEYFDELLRITALGAPADTGQYRLVRLFLREGPDTAIDLPATEKLWPFVSINERFMVVIAMIATLLLNHTGKDELDEAERERSERERHLLLDLLHEVVRSAGSPQLQQPTPPLPTVDPTRENDLRELAVGLVRAVLGRRSPADQAKFDLLWAGAGETSPSRQILDELEQVITDHKVRTADVPQ